MVTVPVRNIDLVVPLAQEATDMRIPETSGLVTQDRSGAVSSLIGASLRRGDVDSTRLTFNNPQAYHARTDAHRQSSLTARVIGGRAASNAAIFTFVNTRTQFGRRCGAASAAPVPIPGLSTRIAALLRLTASESGLQKPYRSLAMSTVTSAKKFFKINSEHSIFQVIPGVPAQDALEQASCFLASSFEVLMNSSEPSELDFAAAHLIEMAKALVDSVTSSLAKGGSHV